MSTDKAITWTSGHYSDYWGTVGKLRLFTYGWGLATEKGQPWQLSTSLPGYDRKRWAFATTDECEAKAEELLRQFVAYLWAHGVPAPPAKPESEATS